MNRREYFLWLEDKISEGRHHHGLLLAFLFDTPFKWSFKLPTDANRARDGEALRSRYANETKDYVLYDESSEPCNVLEMMVALSIRIEEDITGEPGNDHPERWFWEMIRNLGLWDMSDRKFNEGAVAEIIDIWMWHKYAPTGEGSAFPLKTLGNKDQRLMPIWDQMNYYLDEKLYLKGESL